ncbi:MAG: bifunctional DNA-formamidopyrimidine glycosylase/DNA-(apurinic or apyrimidinic site) lyase [Actinomycetota bacterium]|nr:bifunctional DNA-formamidopyrimidine glycosylase/DNA-(apurinic or apyrimidinic site) lyase [Actinomycetota bacterium]
MPELPEVETVRGDLEAAFVGKRIDLVVADGVHRLRRHSRAPELAARLTGRHLVDVRRRGKYLVAGLEGGDSLVVHLGMSGQLRLTDAETPLTPHSHVVIHWQGGGQLRFVDPRTFGQLFVTTTDPVTGAVAELTHLGVDALDNHLTWPQVAVLFAERRTRLKPLLMDQRFIAGIGNLYADEILWASRIRADRRACDLSGPEVRRLWASRRATLRLAIDHRGSSLADAQYRDLSGSVGGYQTFHQAYGREGLPCRRCRTPIIRVRSAGRSGFSCPSCQS